MIKQIASYRRKKSDETKDPLATRAVGLSIQLDAVSAWLHQLAERAPKRKISLCYVRCEGDIICLVVLAANFILYYCGHNLPTCRCGVR